jgi:hypothetical protein
VASDDERLAWNLIVCTTTIIEPDGPAQPITVFVIDHGRTCRLVIPATDEGMLRYAYGDWNDYALGRNDLQHGITAPSVGQTQIAGRSSWRAPHGQDRDRRS